MKSHGLLAEAVQSVFRAVTLNKLLYASPAWWGFAQVSDIDRVESFLRRSKKFGYYKQNGSSFVDLCGRADRVLFTQVLRDENHVLHPLLPPKAAGSHTYNLRRRRHDRLVPSTSTRSDSCNFLSRMLHNNRCEP